MKLATAVIRNHTPNARQGKLPRAASRMAPSHTAQVVAWTKRIFLDIAELTTRRYRGFIDSDEARSARIRCSRGTTSSTGTSRTNRMMSRAGIRNDCRANPTVSFRE